MTTLRLILGDQLSRDLTALSDADPKSDIILMAEVMREATYVRHHKKKIAFLFAAMRHFAEELRAEGFRVRYVRLDDRDNSQSLDGEVARMVDAYVITRIVVTEPGEYRLLSAVNAWSLRFYLPVDIREDRRFLASHEDFRRWIDGLKQPRMEFFYRVMRRKYGILLDANGDPEGGQWNYDADNRKPPRDMPPPPGRLSFRKDAITSEVLDLVRDRFRGHVGELEPFHFAVTRQQALAELHHFIDHLLPQFGAFQDAMAMGEPYLYHSLISAYLNAGLLSPLEICRLAEAAYRESRAPLNAAEGFIRQILGWREYVRGLYWHDMPDYAGMNYLQAQRPLPGFYWTAKTQMACMAEAVRHTLDHAYSHHIQRLMVTGNFALLAGIAPAEVCEWYLAVYADAYEWVELPNTLGMALYGDGGRLGSKPYAASGAYIHRMSNFCDSCAYDPKEALGDKACPFNALYWDFLARHEHRLRGNPRLPYVYANWERMTSERQSALRAKAADTLQRMEDGRL
jgi:deoxyribodipyrimidine photolyase-related protein